MQAGPKASKAFVWTMPWGLALALRKRQRTYALAFLLSQGYDAFWDAGQIDAELQARGQAS